MFSCETCSPLPLWGRGAGGEGRPGLRLAIDLRLYGSANLDNFLDDEVFSIQDIFIPESNYAVSTILKCFVSLAVFACSLVMGAAVDFDYEFEL
jgi:hypothetical protein